MSPDRRSRDSYVLTAILLLALALRLAHWWAVRDLPFFALLAMDSQEYDRWAMELAGGDWLGSGTFFQAPLYPYFLAVLYSVFGHRLDAVYLVQILVAVASCYALYRAGRVYADERVGLAAAFLGATYPVFFFHDVQLLKESLAVSLVCALLWSLGAARALATARSWLITGVLVALLSALRENVLLLVPFLVLFSWRRNRGAKSTLLLAGAYFLGLMIVLSPIAVRNGVAGSAFMPTTFQGGVNFYIGNNPNADGTYKPLVPGKQIPYYERTESVRLAEEELGRELTSSEVSSYWLERSLDWAKAEPLDFVALQLKKVRLFLTWYEWPDAIDFYWVRERSPVLRLPLVEYGGVLILAAVGLFLARTRLDPLLPVLVWIVGSIGATILFFVFSRYRLPTVPGLLILASLPLAELTRRLERHDWKTGALLTTLVLLAVALPRAMGHEPRVELVEYNLARAYQEAGDHERAIHHYLNTLEADPESFLACINLGTYAARDGRLDEALVWFARATAIEPGSDVAAANLGSAHLAEGDLEAARRELDRALGLNSRNPSALHSRALLAEREGDLERAGSLNERMLALEPESPPALALQSRLERAGESDDP